MEAKLALDPPRIAAKLGESTVFAVLAAISFSHFLNDMMQSLFPAIYPVLKSSFNLNFTQIGMLTLAFQGTASILQPVVGLYADRQSRPYLLAAGMGLTLCGLLLISVAGSFTVLLFAGALLGSGSSVFHPEASRVARMASGGQHGLAQSLFQSGGNLGAATGPLLAALIIIPGGRSSVAWFAFVALLGMAILWRIGQWYAERRPAGGPKSRGAQAVSTTGLSHRRTMFAIATLCVLIFSKYLYLASLTNYYTFYLISKFHLTVQDAQFHLFLFLLAAGIGTIIGGPVGDRIGRKRVIWYSILGVLPFTLALPYVDLMWTTVLSVVIGVILSSAFAAIVVFAQELVPEKIGMISGFFFGFAFGVAAIGAAVLGKVADLTSIEFVYKICGFLPIIGIMAAFLPKMEHSRPRRAKGQAAKA